MITFQLRESKNDDPPYIALNKLLKAVQISQSGAMSNIMIEEGLIQLNGNVESRKRAKIRKGDVVTANGNTIEVV